MKSDHRVTRQVYRVKSGDMHVFLIVRPEGVTVIDAGFAGTWALLRQRLDDLGRKPEDVHDILLTHCHPDHAAGLAEIKQATGARVWMHAADAEMVDEGRGFRPWKAAPGLRNWWFSRRVVRRSPQQFEPAEVDEAVRAGETIPVAGGVKVIHTPGHTAGHVVFLWPGDGGVLFTGDVANNVRGLSGPPIYEDAQLTAESLRQVSREKFRVACFAHGEPLIGHADVRFRARWAKA